MTDAISRFGSLIRSEAPKNPLLCRRLLLAGYRAFGFKLRHFPDARLPKSRKYLAALVNRAIVSMLAHPEKAALTSVFLPCELLTAFGVQPMCAELYAAAVNGADAEKVFVEAAEAAGLAETYCSYHKVLMGSAFAGVLPKPGFIVNTSLICDANNLTFRALADYYGIPQYYVDVPPRSDAESLNYVADQLRGLAAFLEKQSGRRLNEAALRTVLVRSKKTVENLRASLDKKGSHSLPGDMTSEMYEIYASHIALGTEGAQRYSELLLADIEKAPPSRGLRLLWLHTLPYWQEPLQKLLNFNDDCQVVGCDINFEGLVDIDPDKPYESMAGRLVNSAWNGGGAGRIETALAMAKKLRADGVVCFCHWGCKQTMGLSLGFKKTLEAGGFPTLVLNGDGCDRSNSSDGQVATRMNAFLEMLRQGKSGRRP
jgi:benzoyl-CoA reductase/2-hydroxyglutaryl-CoA dehydratase subunit BcrC/BadD/HgdB